MNKAWQNLHARTMDPVNGLASVMATRPASNLEGWQNTFQPDSNVTEHLRDAIWVAAGNFSHPFVRQLLGWCVEYADLSAGDPRWDGKWNTGYRDLMRANIASAAAVSRALLEASQCWLLAGDVARARATLNMKKKFRRTQQYFDWYSQLIESLQSGATSTCDHFDAWFDVMRPADWQPPRTGPEGTFVSGDVTLLQLRLSLIRWTWVERQPLAGHWRDVLAQVTAG